MRTKVLLSAAAALAVGAITAQAQVYSVNIVGYVNKVIPAGNSMVANPLNDGTNTLSSAIPNPPDFSNFQVWNGSGFDTYTFASFLGGWDGDPSLAPGQGGFINPGVSSFTNTFVGEVLTGNMTNSIPSGFSVVSSQIPVAGTATDLGLTEDLSDFDNLLKWNGGGYDTYTYVSFLGGWDPSDPSFEVADAFFLNLGAPVNWTQTLNP